MGKEYFSKDDARMRLHGTICMFDGEPVYVDCSPEDVHDVSIFPIETVTGGGKRLKPRTVRYTHPSFVYRSPSLGYMFHKGNAHYISRMPDRQQRQGINPDVLRSRPRIATYDWVYTEDFKRCLLGKYPSFNEAIKMVSNYDAVAVPISRNVAVGAGEKRVIGIYWKGKFVGTHLKGTEKFSLFDLPERTFLKKTIEREGVARCI